MLGDTARAVDGSPATAGARSTTGTQNPASSVLLTDLYQLTMLHAYHDARVDAFLVARERRAGCAARWG